MSVKRPIQPPLYIKHTGIFDMDAVYNYIHGWFARRNYLSHEDLYKHKPGFVKGNEVEIELSGFKRITGYLKHWIEIKFHLWDAEEIEVVQEGKKKKLTQAAIRIVFNAWLEMDWENRWEQNKFLEMLRDFYHKYIIKKKIEEEWEGALFKEEYEMHDTVKKLLEQETSKWQK